MGLRFRKSIKIFKGVRLVFNKDSVGLSVGGRGAGYSVNTKGKKTYHVGLPGTGLSYFKSSKENPKDKSFKMGVDEHGDLTLMPKAEKEVDVLNVASLSAERILKDFEYKNKDINVLDSIESWFNGLKLPLECNINYDYEDSVVYIDLDLPEIEDLPRKNKSKEELQSDYKNYVFGLSIFISSYIFNISPDIKNIIISGYTQRRDNIGEIKNVYLYSIKFDRVLLSNINYRNDDPYKTCMMFENRCILELDNSLKEIKPYEKK